MEQDNDNLPSGRVQTTPDVTTPKTPWKPRISLKAEVTNLLDWGMTEDYDHEPEHSATAKEPSTKADTSPPQQAEAPVWSLDTSSQGSVIETEGSIDSNPVCKSPTAVAHNHHSDSPMMDLPELQGDANMAVLQMLSIKGLRTSTGNGQSGISRRCKNSGMLKKLPTMKEPGLSIQGVT